MELFFNESDHTYKIDASPVPSVTQVISEILGCGWQAEPWYLQRGKVIHRCAELIFKDKEFQFDPRVAGEVAAIRKFKKEVNPEVKALEMRVYSTLHRYAGTLDLVGLLSNKLFLLDWKHSIDKIRVPLQLGGYAQAYKESNGIDINIGYGVHLKENGLYQMTEAIDLRRSRPEFLALRTAYRIKEKCGSLTSQQKEA
jgi:hypothetical protein